MGELPIKDDIRPEQLSKSLGERYLAYALSTITQRAKWIKERFFRPDCSGLIRPRRKKSTLRMGVFHAFIGVMAFMAYALPFMFVTKAHLTRGIADRCYDQRGEWRESTPRFCSCKDRHGLVTKSEQRRLAHFLCCRSSALLSANSFTRKPILGWDGSRSGVIPYSRRVSDVTGPIDPTTARRKPPATS